MLGHWPKTRSSKKPFLWYPSALRWAKLLALMNDDTFDDLISLTISMGNIKFMLMKLMTLLIILMMKLLMIRKKTLMISLWYVLIKDTLYDDTDSAGGIKISEWHCWLYPILKMDTVLVYSSFHQFWQQLYKDFTFIYFYYSKAFAANAASSVGVHYYLKMEFPVTFIPAITNMSRTFILQSGFDDINLTDGIDDTAGVDVIDDIKSFRWNWWLLVLWHWWHLISQMELIPIDEIKSFRWRPFLPRRSKSLELSW